MRHQKIQKMLSLFVDGRLSSTEEQFIQEHLKQCATCRKTLATFNHIHSLNHTTKVTVKPFFATRVLAELKSRQREGFWTLFDFVPRPVIMTGLAVSIIILAIFTAPPINTQDNFTAEYAMFYGDNGDITTVTDDQALAIAINAQPVTNGE